MSVSYFLVCMSCKSGVLLGKSVPIDYFGNACFGFSQTGYAGSERGLDLQQFLLAHRLHELRVLPGNAERYASDVGMPHGFPGSDDNDGLKERQRLANMTKEPPDPESDLAQLDVGLIERLKEF